MHDGHMMTVVVVVNVSVVPIVMVLDDDGFGVGEASEASDGKAENEKGFHRVSGV